MQWRWKTTTAKDENNTTVVLKDIIHGVDAGTDLLGKSGAFSNSISNDIATSEGTPELGGGASSNGSSQRKYNGHSVYKKVKTVENNHDGGGGVDVVADTKIEDRRHDLLEDIEFARQTDKKFIDNTINR
ncbi:unnamed protein product [Ambrosiozyma monospora]|uniref:Unnamed protein product n=1 Tax=Ambrosiozyma monospora TaxID=43982 RepID=A0A9W6Z1Z8_AMBMO|nr:unnamed protein product [Ambrosiozyma monospora]